MLPSNAAIHLCGNAARGVALQLSTCLPASCPIAAGAGSNCCLCAAGGHSLLLLLRQRKGALLWLLLLRQRKGAQLWLLLLRQRKGALLWLLLLRQRKGAQLWLLLLRQRKGAQLWLLLPPLVGPVWLHESCLASPCPSCADHTWPSAWCWQAICPCTSFGQPGNAAISSQLIILLALPGEHGSMSRQHLAASIYWLLCRCLLCFLGTPARLLTRLR